MFVNVCNNLNISPLNAKKIATGYFLMRRDIYPQENISCRNCLKEYNQTRNIPYLVCIQQHTVCQECLLSLKERQPYCPFCRSPIDFNRTCINQQVFDKVKTIQSRNENVSYMPENTRVVNYQNNHPRFEDPPLQPHQRPPNSQLVPVRTLQGPVEGQVQNNEDQKTQQQESRFYKILLAIVITLFLAGYIAILVLSHSLQYSSSTGQCFSYNKTFLYWGTLANFVKIVWNIYAGIIAVLLGSIILFGGFAQNTRCQNDCCIMIIFFGTALFFALKCPWMIIQGISFLAGSEIQYCSSSLVALLVILIIDNLLEYWMWILIVILCRK